MTDPRREMLTSQDSINRRRFFMASLALSGTGRAAERASEMVLDYSRSFILHPGGPGDAVNAPYFRIESRLIVEQAGKRIASLCLAGTHHNENIDLFPFYGDPHPGPGTMSTIYSL